MLQVPQFDVAVVHIRESVSDNRPIDPRIQRIILKIVGFYISHEMKDKMLRRLR